MSDMFQKRHMEAIATAIQEAKKDIESKGHQGLIVSPDAAVDVVTFYLANMLNAGNPNFKRDRFIRACEVGANVRART